MIPAPRLGVDRLADGPEQAQTRAARARHEVVALRHERANGRRRCVERRHAVAVDDVPEAPGVGKRRDALEENLRGPVEEGPEGDVAVARDPAHVGRAPEDVGLGLEIKHEVVREARVDAVACGRVDDALGRARRARRVEDEERVLGVHRLGGARLPRDARRDVVQPHIPRVVPQNIATRVSNDENVAHARPARFGEALHGGVDVGLEGDGRARASALVGRDDEV